MTTINALPPAPTRGDSVNFAAVADTFVAALPPFVTQVSAVASEINAAKIAAETAATTATTKANEAATSASNAATSASSASTSASNAATSASSAAASASTATTKAAEAAASATAAASGIFSGSLSAVGTFTLTAAGSANIELGRVDGVASTPFIDFHAGATAVDYDSRIVAFGGTGAAGGGTLRYTAAAHELLDAGSAKGVKVFAASGVTQVGTGATVGTGSSDFLSIVSAGAAATRLRWYQTGVGQWSAGMEAGANTWQLRTDVGVLLALTVANTGLVTSAGGFTATTGWITASAGNIVATSGQIIQTYNNATDFVDAGLQAISTAGDVIVSWHASGASAAVLKHLRGGDGLQLRRADNELASFLAARITASDFVPTGSSVPTNGMYLPAANTVGFATASTERLRIDSIGQVKYTDPAFPITMPQALCKFGAFATVANGASYNAFQAIAVNGTLIAGTNANFLATATPDTNCLSGWGMRGGAGSNPLIPGNIGAWFENNTHIVWTLEVDCNNEGSSNTTYGDHNRGVGIMVNTGSTYSPDTGIWIHRQTGAGTGPGWQRGIMIDGARQVGIQIQTMTNAGEYLGMVPAATGAMNALLVNIYGDTVGRYWLGGDGSHNWGSGSAVGDVSLSRSGVGTLTLAGGLVVGSATGGGKGAGTINVAGDIYKNNLAYTNPDYVFEHAYTGRIDRFAANDGAADYAGLRPLAEVERITRETLRLPGITDNAMGMFSRTDFLLEKTEEIFLHLFDHEKRLTALAA